MDVQFNRYYNNKDLDACLQKLAEQYPQLVQLSILGESYEGDKIWLATLTNQETGSDQGKPGFWIDGNLHAKEVAGSMVGLYIIHHLLQSYGRDDKVTRILNEQVVYVVPRVNPDGAELALSTPPKFVRSGTRPYPFAEQADGLHEDDIDGDGRVIQMRLKDPSGDWKISDRDPRLMIKRQPHEEGGVYYRLLPEGKIKNYDQDLISIARPLEEIDFNRNFPYHWRSQGQQSGSGDYPGSEPEVEAVLKFLTQHPNIFGALSYHTFSGVLLRPYSDQSDEAFNYSDRLVYDAIGELCTELTGYTYGSTFHRFREQPQEVSTGTFDDWFFYHKGVFAFTVELWDLVTASGIKQKNQCENLVAWYNKHPIEDDYKILDFVDQHAPNGLVEWYKFDHPQLGEVELGGWDQRYTWRNPPSSLLEAELAPQANFVVAFLALAPKLDWVATDITALGSNTYRLVVVFENKGFLPTYISQQALKMKAVQPIQVDIILPETVFLVSGEKKQKISHLEGRSNKLSSYFTCTSPTDNRAKIEWLFHSLEDEIITISVFSEKAGTLHRQIQLKTEA